MTALAAFVVGFWTGAVVAVIAVFAFAAWLTRDDPR
jgi:hypothetical protein